jgi:hypothetical protein
MATYTGSIDKTEGKSSNGNITNMTVGAGGVTAGYSVRLSGGNVVACTSKTDVFYGVALETAVSGIVIKVARTGCKIRTGVTLTADGYVQPQDGGTGGWEDYTDGRRVAIVETSATNASVIRLL